MASSKKPLANKSRSTQPCFVADTLKRQLQALDLTSDTSLLVAFSGGLDSSVLLHAIWQASPSFPIRINVMHVHHGISQYADNWAEFCQNVCENYQVPFLLSKVVVNRDSGLGLEAAARHARYDALNSFKTDWICLAHHESDQAETTLMQLARGAGVKGLSGMAHVDAERRLFRPLLACSRVDLESYARKHQLTWIEDDSNSNTEFDRNFLRHQVLPLLQKRYPNIHSNIARSAQHMAEANKLLDELGATDALQALHGHRMKIGIFKSLSPARQRNLLRWWLQSHQAIMPNTAHLSEMCRQLNSVSSSGALKLKIGAYLTIRQFQEDAYLVDERALALPVARPWLGEDVVQLNAFWQLTFKKQRGRGVALKHLTQSIIQVRQGGERLKYAENRPTQSLKTLFQAAGIPPWQRGVYPLIYSNGRLVLVPNVGCDISLRAAPDEEGIEVSYSPVSSAT